MKNSNAKTRTEKTQAGKPLYKVVSFGSTIEWSDDMTEATSAFNEANVTGREMWLVQPNGTAALLRKG